MMRARLLILTLSIGLIGISSSGFVSAQSLEQAVRHFDEGNLRYRQGDFRGALESFNQAEEGGFVSGALFFNMGNTYYRLDEMGQAVRFYEKAAEIMPGSAELEHNLEIVREQSVDQFSRLPDPFWESWWRFVVRLFGTTSLFVIGMIFYFAAAVVLALRIRSGQTPWRRRLLAASIVLAAVFVGSGFRASMEDESSNRAVVVIDEVRLLDGPGGTRSDLDIHEGLVVDVIRVQENWVEVRLPNGATGWVRGETVGLI